MNEVKFGASSPVKAQVIERREDGSALVEVPVVGIVEKLDLSKTEGGGKGNISIASADLAQMVENFSEWTKPVAVGFDGFDGHQEDRGGPQSVFVDELRVRDDTLFAVMDLNAFAASLVLDEKSYRGFSLEGRRNPKTATKSFKGWVLTGGVFTNNPATDTQFKIAAVGSIESDEHAHIVSHLVFANDANKGDKKMGEEKKTVEETVELTTEKVVEVPKSESVSLSYHNAAIGKHADQLAASESTISTLRASCAAASERIATLEAEVAKGSTADITFEAEKTALTAKCNRLSLEATALRTARDTLTQKCNEQADELAKLGSDNLAAEVKLIVTEALDSDVPPRVFDGWAGDPAGWLKANFTSIDSFRNHVRALRGIDSKSNGSAQKSGHDPSDEAKADERPISDELKARFKSMNIGDGEFIGVKNADEARERFEATQKKTD